MQIGIIGSGTMGAGIAQVAAQAGNRVIVCDTNQIVLDKAKLNLENSMNKLVDKEKITKEKASEIIGNIEWTMDKTSLHQTEFSFCSALEKLLST